MTRRLLLGTAVVIGLMACEGNRTPTGTGISGAPARDELIAEEQEARMEREAEQPQALDEQPRGARTDIAPVEEALGLPGGRHEKGLQGPPRD